MTDATIVALINAVPTAFAALGAFIAALAGLLVSLRNSKKSDEVKAKVDSVETQTTKIHELTNSNLSRVTSQLEVANATLAEFAKAQAASDKNVESLQKLVSTFVKGQNPVAQVSSDAHASTVQMPEGNALLVKIDDSAKPVDVNQVTSKK